jgi:hypothetical protein
MTKPKMPIRGKITPLEVEPLGVPLELRCGVCGRKGSYSVGRLFLDPDRTKEEGEWLNDAFGFTNYVRCAHCNAGGPWELTRASTTLLLTLMEESMSSPEDARIHSAKTALFDGTITRWATQAEAHLKGLIEKEPDNYYLWSRLGNTYVSAEATDLALEAFREAIKRNERDIESQHSIAMILHDRHEDEAAAHHLHLVLTHARHAPEKTSPEMLRNVVRHTLETLAEMHFESNKKIQVNPPREMLEAGGLPPPKPDKEAVLHLFEFDLAKDADWERLTDMWISGKPAERPAEPAPKPRPASSWSPGWKPRVQPERVGRNDPCPCGSGKKFKNCCMKK